MEVLNRTIILNIWFCFDCAMKAKSDATIKDFWNFQ